MRLTAEEISLYAQAAGFTGENLRVAVAVAMAESGGDTEALGDENLTLGGSLGLWQINLRWHPEYYDNYTALYDPQTNANAAYKVYEAQGWSAWSTWKNGRYLRYMNHGPQTFLDDGA